jgi:hypothetical protein
VPQWKSALEIKFHFLNVSEEGQPPPNKLLIGAMLSEHTLAILRRSFLGEVE